MEKTSVLGQSTPYPTSYDPSLLHGIPREQKRTELGVDSSAFKGFDLWQAYELSWLNQRGKPRVSMARFTIPVDSSHIVESKSFKLYLNSFNQQRFESDAAVHDLMVKDLSQVVGATVQVEFLPVDEGWPVSRLPGECIDDLDIEVSGFEFDPALLRLKDNATDLEECLHSHLLKSNCLVTNQPDWASVVIKYRGKSIDHESLLRYLISYRQHNEFHEQCVERIFVDIMRRCKPQELTVYALYTRRGGLDINPFRSTEEDLTGLPRAARQ